MKNLLYIITAIAIVLGVFFYLRSKTEPKFSIEKIDKINKKGVFTFSGKENTFETSGGKTVAGRNGYTVVVSSDGKNSVRFILYKNGITLRLLKEIKF